MSRNLLHAFWNAINQAQNPATVQFIHADVVVVDEMEISPLVRKLTLAYPLTWGTMRPVNEIKSFGFGVSSWGLWLFIYIY
jgi:hypothetical protein